MVDDYDSISIDVVIVVSCISIISVITIRIEKKKEMVLDIC